MLRKLLLYLFGILLTCLLLNSAYAESSERERALEEVVQTLLKRVEVLEAKIEAMNQVSTDSSRIQQRLEKVEEAVTVEALKDNAFKAYWKKGFYLETGDKTVKLRIGGRLHQDFYFGDYDEGDFEEGVRFRRARLYLSGTLYEDVDFKWEYDFAGDGLANWKDVYLEYSGLDFARIRVGHFKEPFGLEELTGTNDMTLIENSPVTSAFAPAYQTGLMLFNSVLDNRMTWQVGGFYTADNAFGDAENESSGTEINGEWDFAARVAGVPWYEDGGKRLFHLGAGYQHREYDESNARYRARGSWSRGDRLVDTGNFAADSSDLVGAEAAFVLGPLSLQGEYMVTLVDDSNGEDQTLQGGYVLASYFLTGENRPYKNGIFKGISPNEDFSLKNGGAGAWELTARYSWLDLDDDIKGGEMEDIALGVNWYLNPNMRIMGNYAYAEEDGDGAGDEAGVFTLRLQVGF